MTAKNVITLPANLQIANVGEYRDKFTSALSSGKDISLKASETTRMDTAGLQLLLSVQAALQAKGKQFKWDGVTSDLAKCVAVLGASSLLNIE